MTVGRPLTDRLTDLGFGAGWSLAKNLPEPVADRIFRQAADTAFRRRGPSVVQLARNLHRVLGDQSTPGIAGRSRPGRDALVRPVLEGDLPAARDGP